MSYDPDTGRKRMTARRLEEILAKDVPGQFNVEVNTVGNLLVTSERGYEGFIDFQAELFDTPDLVSNRRTEAALQAPLATPTSVPPGVPDKERAE